MTQAIQPCLAQALNWPQAFALSFSFVSVAFAVVGVAFAFAPKGISR